MPDGMTRPMLPAVEKFVVEMRKLCEAELEESTLWEKSRELLADLIADPGLKAHARNWPVTGYNPETNKVSNLLFYEDPDYGFVFNATVRKANSVTSVHDHGDVWTLYGIIEGHETMYRYERTDLGSRHKGPATLEALGSKEIGPGDIDTVPPGAIHQEHGGPTDSMAFIVRAQKAGTFKQHTYDVRTGEVKTNDGPTLIPYPLESVS